jgi:hypothetical protein
MTAALTTSAKPTPGLEPKRWIWQTPFAGVTRTGEDRGQWRHDRWGP